MTIKWLSVGDGDIPENCTIVVWWNDQYRFAEYVSDSNCFYVDIGSGVGKIPAYNIEFFYCLPPRISEDAE